MRGQGPHLHMSEQRSRLAEGNGLERIPFRPPTYPLARTSRRKPRRWPLVLRFIKGAIHGTIFIPVLLHTLFAGIVVAVDQYHVMGDLGIPHSIIPSLSIVVGLMLVFRNGTSYERFWEGRNYLTTIQTSIRNLSRAFLSCSHVNERPSTAAERDDTERVIRILVAIMYSVKNHLRQEWGVALPPSASESSQSEPTCSMEYADLLPKGLVGYENEGLGVPLELATLVERYIQMGFDKGWFHGPQASQMQVQVNAIVDAFGKMETIKLTPLPVAHLIHQKQVLALYGAILPFAMVDELIYWAIPVTALLTFTLYGIEGIGAQLEDPFGYDRNDIKMDPIVEDARQEIMVMLSEWKKGGDMFAEDRMMRFFSSESK